VYLPKQIASFLNRSLAFGLLLFFIIPPALKAFHAYEFHSFQKECEHSTTHFHTSSSHNDALDYFFQPLIQYSQSYSTFFVEKNFKTLFENYRLHFSKQRFYKIRLRGPPSFC